VLKIHKNKLVIVWKYMCIGDRTLNGHAVYERAGLDTHKTTHSHVLSAAGREMLRIKSRSCKGCVTAHDIFGNCGHDF
jgi:hypothetical protein